MKMKKETKLRLSQKAHKRALRRLEGKNSLKDRTLYDYHKTVIEAQASIGKKLSRTEKLRIMESLEK